MKYYCARLVRPSKMPTEPRREFVHGPDHRTVWDFETNSYKIETIPLDTNPLCGILGLPPQSWPLGKAYIGGRFSMPVVGGPREFCQPFEWSSFEAAMGDIDNRDSRELGLAFDWPVPSESVRWQLRLYCHSDGSRCVAASDLPWREFRVIWLAAIGSVSAINQRLVLSVNARIVPVDGLVMPEPYTITQCASYRISADSETIPKSGSVDDIAEILRDFRKST